MHTWGTTHSALTCLAHAGKYGSAIRMTRTNGHKPHSSSLSSPRTLPSHTPPPSQLNIDENLFVSLSSPSSSRYDSVADLGSPEVSAARILDQYLTQEFMSTRIGIRREGKVGEMGEQQGGRVHP